MRSAKSPVRLAFMCSAVEALKVVPVKVGPLAMVGVAPGAPSLGQTIASLIPIDQPPVDQIWVRIGPVFTKNPIPLPVLFESSFVGRLRLNFRSPKTGENLDFCFTKIHRVPRVELTGQR